MEEHYDKVNKSKDSDLTNQSPNGITIYGHRGGIGGSATVGGNTGYSGGVPEGYNIDFSTEGTARQSSLDYVEKFNKPNTCLVELQKNDTRIEWKITKYER